MGKRKNMGKRNRAILTPEQEVQLFKGGSVVVDPLQTDPKHPEYIPTQPEAPVNEPCQCCGSAKTKTTIFNFGGDTIAYICADCKTKKKRKGKINKKQEESAEESFDDFQDSEEEAGSYD